MPAAPASDVFIPAPRFEEFEGCTRHAWLDESPPSRGNMAWLGFKNSIHDGNRTIPRRLALSHWHTVEDFVWISENLPSLTELDLSDIQDGVLIDHTTDALDCYTWEELRDTVSDGFWAQIEKLWVRHWGCMALQNSLFRHPSARDKTSGLECRSRRDGKVRDSVCDVTTIVGACSKLKVLSIRGPTVGGGLNKAWHPKRACIEEGGHAHFCALVEGLEDTAPLSMETLELHQAEIGLLLPLLAKFWTLKKIKISLSPILHRYAPGRIKEDVEDPRLERWPKEIASRTTPDNCSLELQDKRLAGMSHGEKRPKLHEWLDSAISTPFEMYPWKNPGMADKLWAACIKEPGVGALSMCHLMKFHTSGPYAHPVRALACDFDSISQAQRDLDKNSSFQRLMTTDSALAYNNVPISPFTFILPDRKIQSPDEVNAMAKDATTTGAKFEWNSLFLPPHEPYPIEPMRPIDMWKTLRRTAPDFAPLWDLDALMSVGFPMEQGMVAPRGALDDSIVRGFLELKRNGIPVRVLLAWRKNAPGLYWGHEHKTLQIHFGTKTLALEHSIPSSCLTNDGRGSSGTAEEQPREEVIKTNIAALVDELVIRYPDWIGGAPTSTGDEANPPQADELAQRLDREAQGWQRWWHHHALHFTSLRRLDIRMPEAFDKFHSKRLALMLLGEGDDGKVTAGRKGKWHLRNNSVEQAVHTRFVSRLWERVGGDDRMEWPAEKWKETAEMFSGMTPFDEIWAKHLPAYYEHRDPEAPDVQAAEMMKVDESDMEMHIRATLPKVESVEPEPVPSKSPEDVVETIETTDTTMGEAAEALRATSPPVVTKTETLSAEPDTGSVGPEDESSGSLTVEPPTSADTKQNLSPMTWSIESNTLHRASHSLADASHSSEQEHSSSEPSKPGPLAPPSSEGASSSASGSASKPRPRARSRSRGRGERRATAGSRSTESSRERRSKRQASEEPEGPAPPMTQRRRLKMERELDWSLKK